MPSGYLIHSDTLRVVIATGFSRPSENRKTGPAIQVWILHNRMNPVTAVSTGADAAICGDCALRGVRGKERACYVNVGQAPYGVFQAWARGSYPKLPDPSLFNGRVVRFGAYGDPVHIPLPKLREIASASAGWTGYTHQWRNPALHGYRAYLMASCETEQQARQAWAMGWRTFRTGSSGAKGEIECLSDSKGITCTECRLCAGASKPAKSIWISPHGSGAKYVPAVGAAP